MTAETARRGRWRRAARYAPNSFTPRGTWHFQLSTARGRLEPVLCGKPAPYARSWRDQSSDNPPESERCKKCTAALTNPPGPVQP